MRNKIGLVCLGLTIGLIIGTLILWIYWAKAYKRNAQLIFLGQDRVILELEVATTQAYQNESPEIGIWALENYLTLFESAVEERTVKENDDKIWFFDFANSEC